MRLLTGTTPTPSLPSRVRDRERYSSRTTPSLRLPHAAAGTGSRRAPCTPPVAGQELHQGSISLSL